MIRRAAPAALVLGLVALAAWLALHPNPPSDAGAASIDRYFTRAHSNAYDGVDRWAYAGMRPDAFIAHLAAAGYRCTDLASSAATPPEQAQMQCARSVRWPVARTLRLVARFNVEPRPALVAVTATSTPDAGPGSFATRMAAWLAQPGWIEPASMTVRGFGIDSPELLVRYVLAAAADDELARGCVDSINPPACAARMRNWQSEGPAPLAAAPAPMLTALWLEAFMERLHLRGAHPRGADGLAEDALLVRVSEGRMWLDFAGRDLAGHPFTVAFELASEGGAPRRMVASAGGATREVALAGERKLANDRSPMYLLPAAGAAQVRPATWMVLPTPSNPASMARTGQALAASDPAFARPAARALVDYLFGYGDRPSQRDLNPPLQQIEVLAADLRAAQAALWPDAAQVGPYARAAYPDAPVVRTALALATCLPAPDSAANACWSDFLRADPEAEALLRSELKERAIDYANLAADHPIRQHLDQLRALVPST